MSKASKAKRPNTAERNPPKTVDPAPEETASDDGFDIVWWAGCAAITAAATILRFIALGLKPFHHDEGVNGFFLTTLYREGTYKYDPANYHGPTLYYITLAFTKLFGLESVPVRWSVAVWGVLMVVLAFWLRRYIGRIGSLAAAGFLAISPGMVFISRYFIHEIFFVFLALAVVVSVVQFIEREKAGPFAIAWTALLLLVCFFPPVIMIAGKIAEPGTNTLLILQIGLFIVEAALVFLLVRMLAAWRDGRPIYFILAAASVSLIFATKETGFISLGTMLIAIGCVFVWEKLTALPILEKSGRNRLIAIFSIPLLAALYKFDAVLEALKWFYENFVTTPGDHGSVRYVIVILVMTSIAALAVWAVRSYREPVTAPPHETPTWSKFRVGLGDGIDMSLLFIAAAIVFVYIWILFFSSFFTFYEGIGRSFEAYAIWTKTGNKDHTQSGFWGYLRWGMIIESPLFLVSMIGFVIALFRGRHRFALFSALWAFGLYIAYSMIPYKTPWLMLSFLLPMAIASGYALNELWASGDIYRRGSAAILALLSVVVMAWQTYDLNFINFDEDRLPYVYAHTNREFADMVEYIEEVAELSGSGKQAKVQIVSPDYWPMVWYMREYPNAVFHGRIAEADGAEAIVSKFNSPQEQEAAKKYGNDYQRVGTYKLRPGVELSLYIRKDLVRYRPPKR